MIASPHVYHVYPDWLAALLHPLLDEHAALSYGKQRAPHSARYSEKQIFEQWYPEQGRLRQETAFCNNANAAIRKSLWNMHSYDETLTGLEDLAWPKWAKEQGYGISYVAEAEIVHVHQETPRRVFNRYRREAMAYKKSYPESHFSIYDFFRLAAANIASDVWHASHEHESSPAFPSLSSAHRDANALWGSDFPSPPLMWSEATGYWGIGKNLTGKELFSSKNGTKWAPAEVLLHPKGGGSPSGVVIAWTAPARMTIDAKYTFGLAASGSNGIEFNVTRRTSGTDAEVVALDNIGSTVTNDLKGLVVAQGVQLLFRFDTCGDATGDIVRADITIHGAPLAAAQATAPQPSGGVSTCRGASTVIGVLPRYRRSACCSAKGSSAPPEATSSCSTTLG